MLIYPSRLHVQTKPSKQVSTLVLFDLRRQHGVVLSQDPHDLVFSVWPNFTALHQ